MCVMSLFLSLWVTPAWPPECPAHMCLVSRPEAGSAGRSTSPGDPGVSRLRSGPQADGGRTVCGASWRITDPTIREDRRMKMLFFPSRAMTPTAAEPIRPEVVAGPAEESRPQPWRQVAAGLAVATVLEILLWGILSAVNRRSLAYLVDQNEITAGVFALACGVTGAIVVWRRPRHLLGWLFVVVAQLVGLADLLAEYAARRPALPLATPALFIGEYIWLPGLAISAALFTPLFPDGRPTSPRWRPLLWAGATCVALVSLPLL